jgi:hypothetical protein
MAPNETLSDLRAQCAKAIALYEQAPLEKRPAIGLAIGRLQDRIGLLRRRRLVSPATEPDAWVDTWSPPR